MVSIDLKETCIDTSEIRPVLHERSPTNWFGYKVEKEKFEGVGGPENLSEILEYFLDTFIPSRLDPDCTIEIGLPVTGYESQLWLNAKGRMISESTLEITVIESYNYSTPGNYLWSNDETLELLNTPGNIPLEINTAFTVGDRVEPYVFQSEDNELRTFLVAPAKKIILE